MPRQPAALGSHGRWLAPAEAPEFKQVWRQMGLEFVAGRVRRRQSGPLLTFDKNAYARSLDRRMGVPRRARTDLDGAYFGNRSLQHSGPPRILRQGGRTSSTIRAAMGSPSTASTRRMRRAGRP
jgi:hypothetical protein